MAAERITVHNIADLKNTSDDAIANYLNSLKFIQSYNLADVRLALGYSAFLIAAACFGWDYKFGFESTKYYTAAAVALYSLLNGALTLWIWLKEKGTVYEATAPSGEKINIASSVKKNVPVYNLKITIIDKSSQVTTIELSESFTKWFDVQGHFVTIPFQEVLATGVPLIGKVDPKRIRSKTHDLLHQSPDVLDALLVASSTPAAESSAASGAEPTPKKGGKRRKA